MDIMGCLYFIWIISFVGISFAACDEEALTVCPIEIFPDAELTFPICVIDLRESSSSYGGLLVAQKDGMILFLNNDSSKTVFLNLSRKVVVSSDPADERGLLSLVLHPKFHENGYFFVHYISEGTDQAAGTSIISRFQANLLRSPIVAELDTELVILKVEQPTKRNNGGALLFQPDQDNYYLFIGIGDGGKGTEDKLSQDLSSYLGKILRIDVGELDVESVPPYRIPGDNPFVEQDDGEKRLPEIWALGIRNPWRCSYTNALYCVDPGEESFEEINMVKKGGNYGWPLVEGNDCTKEEEGEEEEEACDISKFSAPLYSYSNTHDFQAIIDGRFIPGGLIEGIGKNEVFIYYDIALGFRALDTINPDNFIDKPITQSCTELTSIVIDFSQSSNNGNLLIVAADFLDGSAHGHIYSLDIKLLNDCGDDDNSDDEDLSDIQLIVSSATRISFRIIEIICFIWFPILYAHHRCKSDKLE